MVNKLHIFIGSGPCMKVMYALHYANVDFVVDVKKSFEDVKTPEFLKVNPAGKVPVLETEDGNLVESNAILSYVAKKYPESKLYSTDLKEQMEIDQMFHYLASTLEPKVGTFIYTLYGLPFPNINYKQDEYRNRLRSFTDLLKNLDSLLKDKTHLVLNRYTICDILLLSILQKPFAMAIDENCRKAFPNVMSWFNAITACDFYKKNFGNARLCKKSYQVPKVTIKKETAKKEVKKEEPKEDEEPKKVKLDFPKSKFNLYDFKTYFSNCKDRKEAVERLLNEHDPEAFTFYHLKYIKYGDEGKVVFLTNNLMNGFINRAEHMRKHTLGMHAVLGEEPNLEIEAVWMWNWKGMFPLMEEHVQYDVYNYIPLDPKKDADREIIKSFFMLENEDEDKINGLTARSIKFVK